MAKAREIWAHKLEFILTTIGYSVGLGNIWRFPYLCMANGGGAFLIPYFFFLTICGAPLFLAEIVMGQFTNLGIVSIWDFAPFFRGVGLGMLCISGFMCLYYNIIIAWVLYYLAMSFRWILPWSTCGNSWNTPYCYSFKEMIDNNSTFQQFAQDKNISFTNMTNFRWRSSTEEYYLYNTLNVSSSINNLEGINPHILVCFIMAWIITYFCIFKGVKTIGKVSYVTASAPYILLTVIIIQGSLLPGSLKGIKFYIVPEWKTLLGVKVWVSAATQIFYSLGPAWGGVIVMASFNEFHSNVLRTGIMIPVICCMTSFYGAFAIFSIIGHMAHVTDITDISQVIESGPGLAFVVYPMALSLLPGGAIFSVLFFLMLFSLGIGSMFTTYETVVQGILDELPIIQGKIKHVYKIGITVAMAIIGIPLTTRGGAYLFQIIDWYSTPIAVVIIAVAESFAIAYFYNFKKLILHMEMMMRKIIPFVPKWWFVGCIVCLTPFSLLVVFVNVIISFDEPVFNKSQKYPYWAIIFGWILAVLLILPIPIKMVHELIVNRKNLRKAFLPNTAFQKVEAFRLRDNDNQIDDETKMLKSDSILISKSQVLQNSTINL